jgi:hypothetical protein
MSRCRSCEARVVWCETVAGKRMPVDELPSPMGNVTIEPQGSGPPLAVVHAGPVAGGRLSHFASCPNANDHRKR